MLVLERFYGQREIEFPGSQIVLSSRRQNPVSVTMIHTARFIDEQEANP